MFWIFIFLLFFSSFSSSFGIDEFTVSEQIDYQINTNNFASVTHEIKITNNFSQFYPKEYQLTLNGIKPQDLQATDNLGSILKSLETLNGLTKIYLDLPNAKPGKDQTTTFFLRYNLADFATIKGKTKEIFLPQYQNSLNGSVSVNLKIPQSFGRLSFASTNVKNISDPPFYKISLTLPPADKKVLLTFGNYQLFDFNLTYFIKNPSADTSIISIPIPPNTYNQKVTYQSFSQNPNKVEIDSEIDPAAKVEIALNYQGKLLDAYTGGKPVYEIDLMLETDIIKAQKTKFDIYKIAKSIGELLCVIPMTSQLPDNLMDFSPENFDMSIKFFILSRLTINEISIKLNIEQKQIRTVGITVKEELTLPEEKVFNEIELLEDYETFALDTQKNLSAMSQSILSLENNITDTEAINEIFRAIHTLKSATAMLGIKNMSEIAHVLESILDKIRSGLESMTEEKIELLFDVLKFFEECMKSIKNGIKPVISNAALKEKVLKYKEEITEKKLIRVIDVKTEKFQITSFEDLVINEKIAQNMTLYSILVEFIPDLPMKMVNAFMLFKKLKEYGEVVKTIPTMEEIDKGNFEMHFKILFLTSSTIDKFQTALIEDEIKTFEILKYTES